MLSEKAAAISFLVLSPGAGEGEGVASTGIREDRNEQYRKEEQRECFFCEIHGSAPFLEGRGNARCGEIGGFCFRFGNDEESLPSSQIAILS
jgi:hypothetical protein